MVMQRIHYFVAASIDGFIARLDGSYDCFATEGEHVAAYLSELSAFDSVLMGRKTYEIGLRLGVTHPYSPMPCIVFSRTMRASPDPAVELVTGDAGARVRTLKASAGRGIYLCGGGQLAAALFEEDLVDDLTVKVNPVLLGRGVPLLESISKPVNLELISQRSFDSGVVFLRYRLQRPALPAPPL
jgi:dihydrofolate reductase